MNISFIDQPNIRLISVLGALIDESDQQALLKCCHATALPCEVNFFDAETLPAKVIEDLAGLLSQKKELKLIAYHRYVVHQLSRLGIAVKPVSSVNPKPAFSKEIRALVMGGSAASLTSILHLVEHMPVCPVSVFIIQHVSEGQKNLLDQLLKVRTDYEVVMPTHLLPIRTETIYIAPPGHQMKVANGLLYLTRDRKVKFARPSLDVLFSSLATEYGGALAGFLFCGFGSDGIEGCAAIRKVGGLVLAQQGDECGQACVLPDGASRQKACDLSLDLVGLTSCMVSLLLRKHEVDQLRISLMLSALNSRYGYDFNDYQTGTVSRRISKMMRLNVDDDFFDLQWQLLSDQLAFDLFFLEMSINVSGFFRHPEQFRLLRDEVLPYLDSFPLIKIWSAGCATGEEPYSLAILLKEMGMLEKSYIFATDINGYVLKEAESGLFPGAALQQSRENYIEGGGKFSFDDYLEPCAGSFLKVKPELRKRMLFHQHSLVHDGVFNEFQLIVCRNVLIYFNPALSCRVIQLLAGSLHNDGYLMFGSSEAPDMRQASDHLNAYNRSLRTWKLL